MYTIKDLVRRAVIINAGGPAVVTATETVSWSAFHDRVQAMASTLVKRGLQKSDRVAIIALNSARYFEMIYAVLWAGGVVAPINTRFAQREVVHCLEDLDGVWICTDQTCLPQAEEAREFVGGVRGLIYLGENECPKGYISYPELLSGDGMHLNDDPRVDDVAMIFFTGGTTGISKGVMLTHSQVLHASQQTAAGIRSIRYGEMYLHVAPMFHMGDGVMCFVSTMTTCGNAFIDKYDLQRFIDTCNRDNVTWATMVPTMVRSLCLHIAETGARIPTLKGIIYGGSPMSPTLLEMAMNTFPGLEFVQGYGSTEALSITMLEAEFHTLDEKGRRRLRSAGRPFRGVLIGIMDESGKELPQGSVGEVCVRSNAVMKGYWRKPDMTKKALHGNWFHTGDAGYLDEDGFLYLVDRVKDMVITGGENVYSSEVENALQAHADVEECAVIGLPDEKWGEAVHAIVRCKAGRSVGADTLTVHCRQHIAAYKTPKSYSFTSDPLPRTSIGKLRKDELRRSYAAKMA
jgi:long-chain acyl-CoA synthetase